MPNGSFSVKALGGLLETHQLPMKEILGEGYYKNLKILKDTLDVTTRKGSTFNIDQSNIYMDVIRSYVGVFTREGRFLTAGNRYKSKKARAVLTEMILDPEKLKKTSAMLRTRSGSDTARLILTQLGASGIYSVKDNPTKSEESDYLASRITEIKKKDKQKKKLASLQEKKAKAEKLEKLKEDQFSLRQFTQ